MQSPSWHILGAGAIGCLFAAHLSRAGHGVTLILRDETALTRFRRGGGIHLQHRDGTRETVGCAAIALAGGIESPPIRRVLVCTKAHQTGDAVAALRPRLAADALLLLLQNGMGVPERIQALLPASAGIAQAITTEGAWRRSTFEVVHAGRGETLLGPAGAPVDTDAVARALHCGLDIRSDAAFATRQWLKLAVNCVINPLTALRECRNGELLTQPDTAALVRALCGEISAVAERCGPRLPPEQLEQAVFAVMRDTATNQSSMWQDLQHRRRTEIDFINGYVLRRAEAVDIACPTHATLFQAIRQKEEALGCR